MGSHHAPRAKVELVPMGLPAIGVAPMNPVFQVRKGLPVPVRSPLPIGQRARTISFKGRSRRPRRAPQDAASSLAIHCHAGGGVQVAQPRPTEIDGFRVAELKHLGTAKHSVRVPSRASDSHERDANRGALTFKSCCPVNQVAGTPRSPAICRTVPRREPFD
jgi:hypothetical protein